MKINREDAMVHRNCNNCPDTQLTPCHIFECPAINANLREIGVLPSLIDLYDDNIQQITEAVIKIHGLI